MKEWHCLWHCFVHTTIWEAWIEHAYGSVFKETSLPRYNGFISTYWVVYVLQRMLSSGCMITKISLFMPVSAKCATLTNQNNATNKWFPDLSETYHGRRWLRICLSCRDNTTCFLSTTTETSSIWQNSARIHERLMWSNRCDHSLHVMGYPTYSFPITALSSYVVSLDSLYRDYSASPDSTRTLRPNHHWCWFIALQLLYFERK